MITRLLIALVSLLLLIGLWLIVQSWARRSLPRDHRDPDVMACLLCRHSGLCFCGRADRKRSRENDSQRHDCGG